MQSESYRNIDSNSRVITLAPASTKHQRLKVFEIKSPLSEYTLLIELRARYQYHTYLPT